MSSINSVYASLKGNCVSNIFSSHSKLKIAAFSFSVIYCGPVEWRFERRRGSSVDRKNTVRHLIQMMAITESEKEDQVNNKKQSHKGNSSKRCSRKMDSLLSDKDPMLTDFSHLHFNARFFFRFGV
jgi:hypothetical protein